MTKQALRCIGRTAALLSLCICGAVRADGARDNNPTDVRPIPPDGIAVPAADRADLEAGVAALGREIEALRTDLVSRPALLELLPDVQIYHNAVRYALTYNEFFGSGEIGAAREMLREGHERAQALHDGKAPWTTATGLVVRGYVSRIDGSVQPYGLVIPSSYQEPTPHRFRLDIWFHGRGETLSELNFLRDREHNPGEFTPADAFVLHPYGRYCNANRFAGEVDTLEALDQVKRRYPIDSDRVSVRGFSMGGASCWQFAVHYAGDWAAAAPGAGFTETADFLKVFQNEAVKPTWYQQKLWHLYDSVDYAINLFNCPTVAYSGEKDGQKQAADMMSRALQAEGISMVHIIGANAGHFYTQQAKREISQRIDQITARGRAPLPTLVRFTTWTLRYNRMLWVSLDGLERHWERARVEAEITDRNTVMAHTVNISALTFAMPPGLCPLDTTHRARVVIDGQNLTVPAPMSDRSWTVHLRKDGSRWASVDAADDGTLRKRPGLQGPIDDAFMDSFVMVAPTGAPLNRRAGAWCEAERSHAVSQWRRQFRGEARVKNDVDITPGDIADSNLILWGDPSSNRLLARIAGQLPLRWDAAGVRVGTKLFAGDRYAPVFIYPNPLNPHRYIVVNSGFTYREYDYLNNARQTPKLPDYAVVDLSTGPTTRTPGDIADAGFFDERWRLPGTDR